MLVKELIEMLQKLDQEKEIRHMIGYEGISEEEISEISELDCLNDAYEKERMYIIS